MKLKKGDNVIVIAGKAKGQKGTITRALPRENLVVLEGVNLVKRHMRPRRPGQKGQIVDRPAAIHASNVMLLDPKDGKPTRVKISRDKDGNRVRIAARSGQGLK